jgi:tetratricopeptide (TPR) repeat protein
MPRQMRDRAILWCCVFAVAMMLPSWSTMSQQAVPANHDCAGTNPSGRTATNDVAVTLYDAGLRSYHRGDYDRAVAEYGRAIGSDPTFSLAFTGRGLAYFKKGALDRAIDDYEEAIRLDPTFAVAFNSRGTAHYVKRDIAHAMADFEEAIRLAPHYACPYIGRGVILSDEGDLDRAMAAFDEAVRLAPMEAPAFYNRGNVYSKKGEPDRAIEDFVQALTLDPKYAIAFYGRGLAYVQKGDIIGAIQDYDAAIKLNPEALWALSALKARGYARFYLGNFDAAADDLQQTTGDDDAYPMIWLYLARTRSGNPDAMRDLEQRARALNPAEWPYPIVEFLLARRSPEAMMAAATTNDKRCEALFYLGQWRILRSEPESATEALRAAVMICRATARERAGALATIGSLDDRKSAR